MSRQLCVAQIQSKVYPDQAKDLDILETLCHEAASQGADLICAGEMFCCPYETAVFPRYAEETGGSTWQALSSLAKRLGVYLSAGSVPERGPDGRIYNTAYVFDRCGIQIAKHRKVHLFDVDIKGDSHRGAQRFCESETLSAGTHATVFDTEFGRMGLCICFDCRFPEMLRSMVLKGAVMVLVPAAFNLTTGPAHWDVMFRARAIDNQCFMVGTSPARDMEASYHAWGHSLIVSPWGEVLVEAGEKECLQLCTVDLGCVDEVRAQLPLLSWFSGNFQHRENSCSF